MNTSRIILSAFLAYFCTAALYADEQGDREREMLRENPGSSTYNDDQVQLEEREREREEQNSDNDD